MAYSQFKLHCYEKSGMEQTYQRTCDGPWNEVNTEILSNESLIWVQPANAPQTPDLVQYNPGDVLTA